jgi:hypothetical protein
MMLVTMEREDRLTMGLFDRWYEDLGDGETFEFVVIEFRLLFRNEDVGIDRIASQKGGDSLTQGSLALVKSCSERRFISFA